MSLITIKPGAPAIPPGTYPATLISVRPKSLVTRYSKNGEAQDFLEWTWAVEGIEVNSLTTLATGPKSRMLEYLVALVGADKAVVDAGFDEKDLVGLNVLVGIVTNDDGFAAIERVMAAPKARPAAAPSAPAAAATGPATLADIEDEPEQGDDLPF